MAGRKIPQTVCGQKNGPWYFFGQPCIPKLHDISKPLKGEEGNPVSPKLHYISKPLKGKRESVN